MNLNLSLLIPEWVALGSLLTLMITEIIKGQNVGATRRVAHDASGRGNASSLQTFPLIWVLFAFLAFIPLLPLAKISESFAFGGMFISDSFTNFWKAFFALVFAGTVWMSRDYFLGAKEKAAEFLLILWSILIGMFFLASSNHFLVMFISLEIITLSFYALVSYRKNDLSSIESGIKYLILGSLASAFVIFGIALLYFSVGSTSFAGIREAFALDPQNKLMLWGLLFILSGVGFKVASVPFHLWAPDVYQGAPSPVVAFLAIGSKAAGFVILLKLLFSIFAPFGDSRTLLFSVLAVMTILYGNLGALKQTNIKRLLGYSSIGHAGYLLMGIAVGTPLSLVAILYYFIAYAVTNLAAFFVITIVSRNTKSDEITAYTGLAKRSPLLAATLFLSLLSLAGIPPLAGFFGKFLILLSAVNAEMIWLAIVGALAVAVSLYYYLSVVKTMYVEKSTHDEEKIAVSLSNKVILTILIVGIIVVGIWQAPFLQFVEDAISALL